MTYAVAGFLYLPVLAYQMVFQKKNRRGWAERFGRIAIPFTGRGRLWVHGVSLGEVNASRSLVESLQRRMPEYDVVVSSTTDTGFARAVELFGRDRVFRFPLDFHWVARRVLRVLRAELIVLMELEVWPNLMEQASKCGVAVVVANGRLTQRSASRLGKLGIITPRMFGRLAWVGAQDADIARRFQGLGVPEGRIAITGSMKWDTADLGSKVEGVERLARALGLGDRHPVWVCGSTGPGEECKVLDAYDRLIADGLAARLVIVPRKPERFDEVARLIADRSYGCLRRSHHPDDGESAGGDERAIVLGDTMGELRKFYSLARVVFVGRSLVPMGGSDPMEAAALGKAVLCGPHMDNFREPVEALKRGGGLRTVNGAAELADAVAMFCRDADLTARADRASQEVVRSRQGATETTVNELVGLLKK